MFVSCGGNGSNSNDSQQTSDYNQSTMNYPCPECNVNGYIEDYSGDTYPCTKCGSSGVITISSGSNQLFFTDHLSCKKCSCNGYNRSDYGVCDCGHTYEDHCKYSENSPY